MICTKAFVAQLVKNLPAMRGTWVRSLGWEDPLEEGMAIHSSILAWRILWTQEPGRLQSRVAKSWAQLSDLAHSTQMEKIGYTGRMTLWQALETNVGFLQCTTKCSINLH